MQVTIKLFASLAETAGWREKICTLPAGATVAAGWTAATGNAALPPKLLCAVNLNYCDLATVLNDADEVAFFPPVTGG
jgi:sulfur-carrier protein